MQHKIVFATNNPHKLKEIQSLLGDHFRLQSLNEIGFSGDIPEEKTTLEENALDKARFIFEKYACPCFADDTGLEVEALKGEPGVYSARYAGSLKEYGTEEKRSAANISKLLARLSGNQNRNARFRTVIAYIDGKDEHLFEGIVNGSIIDVRRGAEGFGYDPVFVPEGYKDTFAEMPLDGKNKISHRARAFSKFVEYMKGLDVVVSGAE
jgi:XTP/dITP diphosphohydrolase